MRKREWKTAGRCALWIAAALAAVSAVRGAAVRLDSGRREEGARRLEEAIRRAAVSCYADEGVYPPTLESLVQRYGIQVGEDYTVFYEAYAENLMPEITVVAREAEP